MRQPFLWDPRKLSLQIDEMDHEHRHLIGLMNRLQQLHEAGVPAVQQGKAFAALAEYTQRHFAHEEAYMARIGYPGLATHQGVHRSLMGRLNAHAVEFKRSGAFSPDLFVFLHMWLRSHICGVDMQYAHHAHLAQAPQGLAAG